MLDRTLEFGHALRDAGIPCSVVEEIDALRALQHVELRKEQMKAAFAATLVKDDSHRAAFEVLFELYFGTQGEVDASRDMALPVDVEDVRAEVERALSSGDGGALREAARRAVAELGRPDRRRAWWSNYDVVRALDLDGMLEQLIAEIDDDATPLDARLRREEFEARVAAMRAAILAETRRRVAEARGPEAVASYAVPPLPENQVFTSATADIGELRRAVRLLARKLATRIAMKRRRSRRGHLDIRRTVRRSLSTGGVFLDASFRHRVPHRPELFVLCDVSSSVARFSRFALMLTHALASQFSKVRSFAFVDRLDEVTDYFGDEDFVAAVEAMEREAEVVGFEGRSDYGACLGAFWDRCRRDLTPKATVLILGDARNNYRDTGHNSLEAVAENVRHTFWLNPEPHGDWDTGDSAASTYAAVVDRMVEVRNLRQLEDFIAKEL